MHYRSKNSSLRFENTFVFSRTANIYTFSKNPLARKVDVLHLFIPWEESQTPELMYTIKSIIKNNKICYLPLMNKDLKQLKLDNQIYGELIGQLNKGLETHLIMSNKDSIHIFKLNAIFNKKSRPKNIKSGINKIDRSSNRYDIWLELGDVYLFKANHFEQSYGGVESDLQKLISEIQYHEVFTKLSRFHFFKGDELSAKNNDSSKWVDLKREVTYDYFIRELSLKENIFHHSWELMGSGTRHFLICSQLHRYRGILSKDFDKLSAFKESFEFYYSALVNELNEIYIRPLRSAFRTYPSLREAWNEIKSHIRPVQEEIIDSLIENDDKGIDNLDDFLEYQKYAKSFLFSLKNKFTKKIAKEEYLLIESFLNRSEGLIESFSFKGLDKHFDQINLIKKSLQNVFKTQNARPELYLLKNLNLKLGHILMLLNGNDYTENIFFKLLEEKTLKAVHRRALKDEVQELLLLNKELIFNKNAA